jgi:hypothetical protein
VTAQIADRFAVIERLLLIAQSASRVGVLKIAEQPSFAYAGLAYDERRGAPAFRRGRREKGRSGRRRG